MPVDSARFRETMGSFATGVTVVTIPGPERPHGITVNAFASVSLDPPLVLVSLGHDTQAHELLAADDPAPGYCVTVLSADQRHLGEHFANITVLPEDPFETEATRTGVTGAPIFTDGLAYVDCTVRSAHPEGDHTVYVGSVEEADVLDAEAPALTWFRSDWGRLEGA